MTGETTGYQKQGVVCLCIRGKWEYKWWELRFPNYQLADSNYQEVALRLSIQADNLSFQGFNLISKVSAMRLVSIAE